MFPRCVPPFFVRGSRPRGKSRLTQYFYFQNGWGPPLRSGARFELTLKNAVRGATRCIILPPSSGLCELAFFNIYNSFDEFACDWRSINVTSDYSILKKSDWISQAIVFYWLINYRTFIDKRSMIVRDFSSSQIIVVLHADPKCYKKNNKQR